MGESNPSFRSRERIVKPVRGIEGHLPMRATSRGQFKLSTMAASRLRRIARNAASMLASDVVNRVTTFALYALVARHLGAVEFGQMSLALSMFFTFGVFAGAGLKTLITREVAKDSGQTDRYLVNGSAVSFVSSLLSLGFLLLLVRLMRYSTDTAAIVVLLGLGLLPRSLSTVCEGVFQAREQMHFIAYANGLASLVKVGLAFLILSRGHGLGGLVMLLVVSQLATLGVEWWLMLKHITRPRFQIDPRFSLRMIRSTSTFLGIDGVVGIWASLNILILSTLATETEVGYYSAVSQVMVPVMLVLESIALSVFPAMCRRFQVSLQDSKAIAQGLIEIMLTIALPVVIGLSFLADGVLLLVYGRDDFLLASGALRILVWSLIPLGLDHVLGKVLVATLREKVTLRIVTIDLVVALVLGLLLVRWLGVTGAAIAAVITKLVDFFQHYVPVSRLLPRMSVTLRRAAWKPVVATIFMALCLAVVRGRGLVLAVASGGAAYAAILLALTVWSVGGISRFKDSWLRLLGRPAPGACGEEAG